VAQSSSLTVFISLKGDGGEWHNYAVDDCALTSEAIPLRFEAPVVQADGTVQLTLLGRANRTNRVEASSTLTNWGVFTNVWNATGRTVMTVPPSAGTSNRFFRARQSP